MINEPPSLALEPRQTAARNGDHIHPLPEPQLQFAGHALGGRKAILYF